MLPTLWHLAKATYKEFLDDDCMHMAAGIAYYALFSIFPLLLGIIAIVGVVLEPGTLQGAVLDYATEIFPGSRELVSTNVEGIVSSRGTLGLLSFLGLLWSGMAIFAAIRRSLNRAWDIEQERPFWRQKLVELAMMVGVGLILMTSIVVTAFFRILLGLNSEAAAGIATPLATLGSFMPLLLDFVVFAAIYRFVPNTPAVWSDVWPGAVLAAVLFEGGKHLFLWYMTNFADYSLVYGSLASVIAFLFWSYISAIILLLGAEVAAEYSRLPHRREARDASSR